jgi:hypothetical protein
MSKTNSKSIEATLEPSLSAGSIVDHESTVILHSIDDSGDQAIISLGGRKYVLSHPGARKAMKMRQAVINLQEGSLNNDKLLDEFFRVCVEPYDSGVLKPDLDNSKSVSYNEVEVWLRIANRFLSGKLEL